MLSYAELVGAREKHLKSHEIAEERKILLPIAGQFTTSSYLLSYFPFFFLLSTKGLATWWEALRI